MAIKIDSMMRAEWFSQSVSVVERTPFNDVTIQDVATILGNAEQEPWSQ